MPSCFSKTANFPLLTYIFFSFKIASQMNSPSCQKITALLLAGGVGSRLKSPIPKQYLSLDEKPLVQYSLDLFSSLKEISSITIVCYPEFQKKFDLKGEKPVQFALPGKERQNSVESGYFSSPLSDYFLIHDTARPLIQKAEILKLLEEGLPIGAATLGVPITSTVKQINQDRLVKKTLNRSELFEIQTPQLLRADLLKRGLEKAKEDKKLYTDDVSLAESLGHPVKIVTGSSSNFKITTDQDLFVARQLIIKRYADDS
jgi:2-C-methyl-D-erythritol 4-phosphate cytidylyltransferase